MSAPAAGSVGAAPARLLGAGGEAEVFEVPGRPHLAFKRYRRPTPARASKLTAMVDHPPQVEGAQAALAWPVEVVTGPGGDVVGFLMPRVDLATSVAVFRVYNPQSRQKVAPAFTWRYLLRTARNVAAIVDAVHRAGHVIGDLNESNLLVSNRALVSLVDCDSMQVTDPATGDVFPCPVGKPEFTAPELYRRRGGLRLRTPASDAFALGVLIFLLLMEGAHPFAGVWRGRGEPPDIASRIGRRVFPYRRRSRLRPPPMALPLSALPPALRRMAWRACTARPSRRPTPADWVDALDRAEDELVECPRSPHHVHGRHTRCPWCARIDAGMPDPFPGPTGASGLRPRPPTRWQRLNAELRRRAARARRRAAGAVSAAATAALSAVRRRHVAGESGGQAGRSPLLAGIGRVGGAGAGDGERAGWRARRARGRPAARGPSWMVRWRALATVEAPAIVAAVAACSVAPAVALPTLAVAIPSAHAVYQARTRGRGRIGTAASMATLLPENLAAFARRLGAIASVGGPAAVMAGAVLTTWSRSPLAGMGSVDLARAAWPAVAGALLVAVAALPGRSHPQWPAGVAVARARMQAAASLRWALVLWASPAALVLLAR